MSSAVTRVAVATTVALLAGLGLTGSGSASAASFEDECAGMSAPQHAAAGNQAPRPVNDTARGVAGGTTVINVLANDTDPDHNKLYVVSVSSPARGSTCVDANGEIEYDAASSSTDYTEAFTYGVTDGDLYRTATVNVSVEGVKPVVAVLKHKLTYKKHTHVVKHRARVSFHNTNTRSVIVLAGGPKKKKPSFRHTVKPGQTVGFSTRSKRIQYVVVMPLPNDDFSFADLGLLNTRTGHQRVLAPGDGARFASGARSLASRWLQQ